MNVLFVCQGDSSLPSTRHRVYQLIPQLEQAGFHCNVIPGRRWRWGTRQFASYSLSTIRKYFPRVQNADVVVFQKLADPLAVLLMRWAKRRNTPVIFDYDDALYAARRLGTLSLESAIRNSSMTTAGSRALVEHAKPLAPRTVLVPTAVDTDLFSPVTQPAASGRVTIGWLGAGAQHLDHLRLLQAPLQSLSQNHRIRLKLVSSLGSPQIKRLFQRLEGRMEIDYGHPTWVDLREIPAMISDFDIGVMPLTDSEWARGKCAMKALECMAMGIPVVVSAVGENPHVVRDRQDGFVVDNEKGWEAALESLIVSPSLRRKMGASARARAEHLYSVAAIAGKVARTLKTL